MTFGREPQSGHTVNTAAFRLLYLQNKSLAVEGNFQSVDSITSVLTENTPTGSSVISVKSQLAPVTLKIKRFEGLKLRQCCTEPLDRRRVRNSHCFSQTSSSPPGSGSVPPQTWPPGPASHTPSPAHEVTQTRQTRGGAEPTPPPDAPGHLTCAVTARRPRPSSSRSSSEPAEHGEENAQSEALRSPPKQEGI